MHMPTYSWNDTILIGACCNKLHVKNHPKITKRVILEVSLPKLWDVLSQDTKKAE